MVAELGQRLLQDLKGGKTRISPSRSVTHSVSCTLQDSPNNNNKKRQQRTRCTRECWTGVVQQLQTGKKYIGDSYTIGLQGLKRVKTRTG